MISRRIIGLKENNNIKKFFYSTTAVAVSSMDIRERVNDIENTSRILLKESFIKAIKPSLFSNDSKITFSSPKTKNKDFNEIVDNHITNDIVSRYSQQRILANSLINHDTLLPSLNRSIGVLFICGHNAGRSQMAHALLEKKILELTKTKKFFSTNNNNLMKIEHPERICVFSCGSNPGTGINLKVAQLVKNEYGIDLSAPNYFPKPSNNEFRNGCFYHITMGCGDKINGPSGCGGPLCDSTSINKAFESRDWALPDPHQQDINFIKEKVKPGIEKGIDNLIKEIIERFPHIVN